MSGDHLDTHPHVVISSSDFMPDDRSTDLRAIELILVCPSLDGECGIARYTDYVAEAIRPSLKAVRTVSDSVSALQAAAASSGECVVLFQHEYGLLDFNSRNAGFETTAGVIRNLSAIQELGPRCRVAVVMHSVVLHDHVANAVNKQWFAAGLPLFSLSRDGAEAACVNYSEHGIHPISPSCEAPETFRIGAFGLLSANKDIESVLQLCLATDSPIQANFASRDPDAIAGVTQRARDLGVNGRLSFDFLPERELMTFLQRSSVIYLPQHDFSHFATSGSARFALSARRAVIAPPHRPFHDLASAIYFADLAEAIEEVRRLKGSEPRMRRHLAAGERYLQIADLAQVYSSLLRRLCTDEVWTGGSSEMSLPLETLTAEALDRRVAENTQLTAQEQASFRQCAMGVSRGVLLRALPSFAIKADDDPCTDHPSASTAPAKVSAPFPAHDDPAAGGAEPFASESQALSYSIKGGAEESFLLEVLAHRRKALMDMRLVRSPGSYLSAIVFFQLPLYIQLLVLLFEFHVPVEDVSAYAARNDASLEARDLTEGARRRLLISGIEDLELLSRRCPELAQQLVWGCVPFPVGPRRQRLVYPASLLTYGAERFVLALYRVLLQREPDRQGFQSYRREMKQGRSKSLLAHQMARSAEAQALGVRLHGDERCWEEIELRIADDLLLCAALAPPGAGMLSDNLAYIARTADGALLEHLRRPDASAEPPS